MNKLTCDIVMDLIPLVKDGVASNDSKDAVYEHLKECQECREMFEHFELIPSSNQLDDKKVFGKIKKKINIAILILTGLSILFGTSLTLSENMFYNIIIMPTIGAVSYIALKSKAYLVPIFVYIVTSIWHLFIFIGEMGWYLGDLMTVLYWGGIYAGLCALGLVVAFLLHFALKKERRWVEK